VQLIPTDDTVAANPIVVARPAVNVQLVPIDDVVPISFLYAQPLVTVTLPPVDDEIIPSSYITVAKPSVGVQLWPLEEDLAGVINPIVVARPLVQFLLPPGDNEVPPNRLTIGNPPVSVKFLEPPQQAFLPLVKPQSPKL
jgi:hypothetical protein